MDTKKNQAIDNINSPINIDSDKFHALSHYALQTAKKLGADEAAVGLAINQGISANVRLNELETLEAQQDQSFGVTVFVDKKKGTAATSILDKQSIEETVRKAISIASFTVEDPYAGLADAHRMATEIKNLDQYYPCEASIDEIVAMLKTCEESALNLDRRITNSDGAGFATQQAYSLFANSHDFIGEQLNSHSSLSITVIAESEQSMERDYWYDLAIDATDLQAPEVIGKMAGRRTVNRLGSRVLDTQEAPVIFAPEIARSLFASLLSALGGMNQYRKSSFLLDAQGETIFPGFLNISIEPHLPKRLYSSYFDSEGVATYARDLVNQGVVEGYILGSYSARKLGLETTANSGGVQNLIVNHTGHTQADLLAEMGTGLLLTEVMGQGVNLVTGDYSRGAAGFWIEDGEIQYPVSEITIAGNLKNMYQDIIAIGNDTDKRSNIQTGSVLIKKMMIAGN